MQLLIIHFKKLLIMINIIFILSGCFLIKRTIDFPNKFSQDFLTYNSNLKSNKKTMRIINYENERIEKPGLLKCEKDIYDNKD